jgi:FkbM family methyltransferase
MAKRIATLFMGTSCRPRRILRGLPRGYKIIVSPRDNLGCLLGTQEAHLQNIIRKHVLPGQTVYDIGANMGFASLSLSKQVGPTGTVIDFEPVPENLALLHANVEANHISNVQVFDYAASNQCGEAIIKITSNLSTASLVWHTNDPKASRFKVKTITIDHLVRRAEIREPKFVKIDVEGAEGQVLEGMRETIASSKPTIFLECSDIGRLASWSLLHQIGYRCLRATTLHPIESFGDYRHADFLWLPPTHH